MTAPNPSPLTPELIESVISGLPIQGRIMLRLILLQHFDVTDEEIQYTVSRNGKTLRRGRGRTDPMGRVEIPYRENFAGARLSILFNNPAQSVVEKVFKLPNVTVRENSIQFFPEGGHLLTGVLNRIAAKSIRPDGLGIGSMTKIVTTAGDTIAILETN